MRFNPIDWALMRSGVAVSGGTSSPSRRAKIRDVRWVARGGGLDIVEGAGRYQTVVKEVPGKQARRASKRESGVLISLSA